jgi:chromate transporter
MLYLRIFITYLKIGLFNFGGGYPMMSLIQNETVVKHRWITMQEFTNIAALSQITPGPIGINIATWTGYTVTGNILGAATATIAVTLPSFAIILAIAGAISKTSRNRYLSAAVAGIKTILPGLIAAAALQMANPENFIDTKTIIIFILAFILIKHFKLHPILLILSAAAAGILIF